MLAIALRFGAAGTASALGGCGGDLPGLRSSAPRSTEQSQGNGGVKVGLLLPLSARGEAGAAAGSLKNGASLALSEFQDANVELLIKDDLGTPEGAREAAEQAFAEGAEILVGPLFAASVAAAGQVAKAAGKPIIAFSTDATVASQGVYLLSFLPENEVERIVAYASAQGRRSFAALVADTPYGNVAAAAFQQATSSHGATVLALERYGAGGLDGPARRVATMGSGSAPRIDALFIPDSADRLADIAPLLQSAGFNAGKVKLLGTGVWNDARTFRLQGFEGGWFAAPEVSGFDAFAARYRAKFGSDPTRIATLAYDAVSLVAALVRTRGAQRFAGPVITNSSGFNGADGVFRFKRDGLNERALAVFEIRNGAASIISAAPRSLGAARG